MHIRNKLVPNYDKRNMAKRALIVDDYEDNIMLLQEIVELLDFETDYVENGQLAVDAVKEKDYDVVLMDIEMPVLNGFEASEEIRRLMEPKNAVPIVAISAHSADFFEDKIKNAGINDFISKPYTFSKLGRVLAQLGL